jgi:internalin A
MPDPSDDLAAALARIAQEADARTGTLDLTGLRLDALPEPLFELTHLRELRLGSTDEEFTWGDYPNCFGLSFRRLGRLPLESLSIRGMRIDSLAGVELMTRLTGLDCSRTQVADLAPIAGLLALQSLVCYDTQVADLEPIAGLHALQSLECSLTQIADLEPIAGLHALQSLHCSRTQVADLEPIAGLLALQSLDCSHTQVADLEPIAGLLALQSLDCSLTQVADLAPIAGLLALQSLHCSFTQVADLAPIAGLFALQSLDCSRTQVADLEPIAGLLALQSFECFGTQVADLAPIAGLLALQSLDCSSTQVVDLAPIAGLLALRSLDCSDTQVADLAPIAGLLALQSLVCSRTQVANLAPIAGLLALQSLFCCNTQVADLAPIAGLLALQSLDCSDTHVADLAPIAGLLALQSLDCSDTQVADLTPIAGLLALQSLDCSDTQVTDLGPLGRLLELQTLDASGLRIGQFPDWLNGAAALEELLLFATRLPGTPPEVLSQHYGDNCLESLRAHRLDLAAGAVPSRDVKLMVLGNGRVGKTQICRRLRGLDYDETIDSTHGIVVASAELPIVGRAPARLHIWDFGGQDIYHGTHALFLRANAVFALVFARGLEDRDTHVHKGMEFRNRPLRYWVDYTRHLGGADIAAVVVQTRCDAPGDKMICPVTEPTLHESFGFYESLTYSALNNRNRATLDEALGEAVVWLQEQQGIVEIGAGRARVKERIEQMRDANAARPEAERRWRWITQEDFAQICREENGPSETRFLLAYLHNAGIVFYREGLFDDRILLDQGWALEAIYAVFHRERSLKALRGARGRFTRSLLELLVWDGFKIEEQELFLGMMQSCGVCFVHKGGDEFAETEYVAPELLPEKAAAADEIAAQWDEDAPFEETVYHHDLLHQGLIRAIVSRIGREAGVGALYWRDGVCVFERMTRAHALIEQEMDEGWSGRIRLRAQGGRAAELLARLRELVEQEQSRIGLVPRATSGETPRVPFPERGHEEAPPLDFGPEPAPGPRRYVSYAWNDPGPGGPDREAIVDRLCAEAAARGKPILRDKNELKRGDSIARFMQAIGTGDLIFVILSDKYLKSEYCMNELFEIWRYSRHDEQDFFRRVRIFALEDARAWKSRDRLLYSKYWIEQRNELREAADEVGMEYLGETDHHRLRLMQDFAHHVGEILARIANRVTARDLAELTADDFD